MNPKAAIGLVKSREAYIRDWFPVFEKHGVERYRLDEPSYERVFDLSEVIVGHEDREIVWDWTKVGRELPFPMLALVGNGEGVFIVLGNEEGFYVYCYSSPVPLAIVRFTIDGCRWDGMKMGPEGEPVLVSDGDPMARSLVETTAMMLKLVTDACNDTRHIVSYTLNRAERRATSKATGSDMLDSIIVHRVCLNHRTREGFATKRGDTVVPTPKRLHEVRAHYRHLKSGVVTRVKAHRRGSRGTLIPKVYAISDKGVTLSERVAPDGGSE